MRAILFDLDGTLTDPKEGITNSVAYALEKAGIPIEDKNDLITFIGPPLADSFAQFYGFNKEQCDEAIKQYRVYFKEKGILENKVYPGIKTMLQQLKEDGRQLFVATSKPHDFAKTILHHYHLAEYFDGIYGSELDGTRSRKGEVIAYILEKENLEKEHCVMVGDRKHDILGAKEHDLASVGVLFGYGDEEELQLAGADVIVNDVEELKQYLLSKR